MDITDQDIQLILADKNILEFLCCLNGFDSLSHKVIINLLIFMFFSDYTKKIDWVEDFMFIFENNIFKEDSYAPCIIKTHAEITLYYLKKKLLILKNRKVVHFKQYNITYKMFNEYITNLYIWCKENFDCQ